MVKMCYIRLLCFQIHILLIIKSVIFFLLIDLTNNRLTTCKNHNKLTMAVEFTTICTNPDGRKDSS